MTERKCLGLSSTVDVQDTAGDGMCRDEPEERWQRTDTGSSGQLPRSMLPQ